MSYRCVHCSATYADDAQEVLEGCGSCKSKFFFYIKEEKLKHVTSEQTTAEKEVLDLSPREKQQIEEDIRDIVGISDDERPVFLDFESVRVLKPGKYLLDLQKLFSQGKPRVYQLEDGKYIVDLSNFFSGVV